MHSSRHRRRYILILYISLAFVHNKFDYINLRMSNATARRRGRRKRTAAGHSHRTARTRPARRCARPTDVRDRGCMHLNTVFSNKSALALSPGGGAGGRCYGPDASWTSVSLLDLASALGPGCAGAPGRDRATRLSWRRTPIRPKPRAFDFIANRGPIIVRAQGRVVDRVVVGVGAVGPAHREVAAL